MLLTRTSVMKKINQGVGLALRSDTKVVIYIQ